ncbi:AAA family ATPase [Halovivax limisalsi]|uniref:AAA family ATPase n=1 Tax=Halovivax limisalsi TaxID=1453760 RepID=UPI001FFDE993|nr:AAA family ATPase [Halovivax limisalsi]
MEVDVQILGGVAVTVLLALLFFATVVLWDISLALRGVGDKIDKLEDTLDDDITDLTHTVDGTAGGGTQLHLNGGGTTIGSGPDAGQVATAAGPHTAATGAGATRTEPSTASDHPAGGHAADAATEPADSATDGVESSDETAADPAETQVEEGESDAPPQPSRASLGADPTPVRGPNAPDRRPDESGATTADEASAADPAEAPNRGRFVTSPDRTPWYATPLDRETIAANQSVIAGALESGSPDASAEEDGDDSTVTAEQEPIVLGGTTTPAADDADDPDTDDGVVTTDPVGDADSVAQADAAEGAGAGDADADEEGTTAEEADSSADAGDSLLDRGSLSTDVDEEAASIFDVVTEDELEAVARTTDGEEPVDDRTAAELFEALLEDLGLLELRTRLDEERQTRTDEADAATANASAADEDDTDRDAPAASTAEPSGPNSSDSELTAGDPDRDADESDVQAEPSAESTDATERADGSELDHESDDPDRESTDDPDSDPVDERDADGEGDASALETANDEVDPDADVTEASVDGSTEGIEYTFEEFSPEDTRSAEISVDDAVERVNDEAPSLSRSTRRLTAKATADDDGVTLTYELDDEATDSTNRLLRYQLEQFADQAAGEVDVSVSGNRVVVDIPDADGSTVSQWRRAIVEVIDRTYYLSDNTEE